MNHQRPATTVPELLCRRVEETPHAAAVYRRLGARQWAGTTWSELEDQVQRLAAALKRLGVRKGDRLAIYARTCPKWQVAELAGLLAGAVVVGVDAHASAEQVAYVLRHSGAKFMVVDEADKARQIPEGIRRGLALVIAMESSADGPRDGDCRLWDEVFGGAPLPGDGDAVSFPALTGDDPATLIYTSGTTGRPKAIEYTHHLLLVACQAIARAVPELGPADRLLCWLPMAHLFQRMVNLTAIVHGTQTYFVEDPREIMTSIGEVRPSLFVAVPRFYERLYEGIARRLARQPRWMAWITRTALRAGAAHAGRARRGERPSPGQWLWHAVLDRLVLRKIRAAMGGRIKFMITGSAPTPAWLLEFFHSVGLLMLEAYGISENTVPMAMNLPEDYRFGSVGRPLPGNEIRLAPDGEVLVRGPGVFCGYHEADDEGRRFTAEGFYRTGDLGHLDEEGFLYLTGRKAEIIKTSTGRRISPARVEAAYAQSPLMDQVVVFGNARKYLVGLLVLRRSAVEEALAETGVDVAASDGNIHQLPATEALVHRELDRWGRELAPHERIVDFAILPEPLSVARGELTPTLKVRRGRVAELYSHLIDPLYGEPCENWADRPSPHAAEGLIPCAAS